MATYNVKCVGSHTDPGSIHKATVALPDGITVLELLEYLLDNTDFLGSRACFGENKPEEVFRILVNGRNIRVLEGTETVLKDGAQVAILVPIAGGGIL